MKKYLLEIIVFCCGAVVMIFELVGSRILGPYLGTSIFVWTSLIGIILGSLSLGYWWGGKLADKNPSAKILALVIFLAALLISLTAMIKEPFLQLSTFWLKDIKINSLLTTLLLFAPASIFLGMVSPYAVKLKMRELTLAGTTVGNLYALSTVGSIVGTFLAGFVLIPTLGNTKILYLLTVILILNSLLLLPKSYLKNNLFILLIIFTVVSIINPADFINPQKKVVELETLYNHVTIFDSREPTTQRPLRHLKLNTEFHSSIYLDDKDLVYEYTKYYRLAKHFKPDLTNGLMIGGGAYTYPQDFLKNFPQATLEVVEIDPQLTLLARQYFFLEDNPRLTIYHEDGRTFLNRTQKTYDVIFGDIFRSFYSIPFQLTTKETVQKIFNALNDDGLVMLNIVSAIEGDKGQFLRAEYATFKSVFPQVYLFPVTTMVESKNVQNIMLVAFKSTQAPDFTSADPTFNEYLSHLWTKLIPLDMPILTDDFSPVDYYISKLL